MKTNNAANSAFLKSALIFLVLSVAAGCGGKTWQDPATKLTWQVSPAPNSMTWQSGFDYCESLKLGGYDDWRLPKLQELESLITGCDVCKNAGLAACAGCPSKMGPHQGYYQPKELEPISSKYTGIFWSSTTRDTGIKNAWFVSFGDATIDSINAIEYNYVRCVR